MSELTKLRLTDKRDLLPYIEAWKGMEWSLDFYDQFGGHMVATYDSGPALIEAICRLNPVFDLSAEERKEITQLEGTDPQRAQQRVSELGSEKASLFYGALVQHFSSELIPSVREAIGDLVTKVIDVMVMEFGGDLSKGATGSKKRGPRPLFVNKGECLAFIAYAEKRIQDRGETVTLSAIAREIMTLKGRNVEKAYRVLKRHMDKFEVQWTREGGAASKV